MTSSPIPRNYGLDVARAMAIVMVVFIHSIHSAFRYSPPLFWYISRGGVELFFSLSGFLIGKILLNMFSQQKLTGSELIRFWKKRWLRTVPLYLVLLLVYFAITNLFYKPVSFDFSYLIFSQSLTQSRKFFPESWSICVEEWFYIMIPLTGFFFHWLMTGMAKRYDRQYAIIVAAIFFIFCMIILRQWFMQNPHYHYGVLFRLDACAYGIIAAWLSSFKPALKNNTAVLMLLAGLLTWAFAVYIHVNDMVPIAIRPMYYPLCGAATAAVVTALYYIQFTKELAAVKFISRISYSVYLVNFTGIYYPISMLSSAAGRLEQAGYWLAGMLLVTAVAYTTYRFIESPFLRLKDNLK
jgi:peptidoglycan/LPS O-acetylase OafA/YrhL